MTGLYYTACRPSVLQELPAACGPGSIVSPDEHPVSLEPTVGAAITASCDSLQEDANAADAAVPTDMPDIKELIRELHQNGESIRAITAQVHKSTTCHRVIHE